MLWLGIVASVINIFPSAGLGRSLNTGRFLFHHYLYGVIVLACAIAFVLAFAPVPISILFFVNNSSVTVNLGRFFVLGGLALVLDDLPDVSSRLESALNRLKFYVGQKSRFIDMFQLFCGTISLYIFAAIVLSMYFRPEWVTLANVIVSVSIFITGLTSFIFVHREVWLRINS